MTTRDVLDISEYAQALHKRRFRRLARSVIPILCLLVMIGAIVGIAAYSYNQNHRDALTLSNNLIRLLNSRITAQIENYLSPVSEMVRLTAGVLKNEAFDTLRRDQTEPFAFQIFKNYPQIVALNIGDSSGNFLMVKRMADSSFHTKTIKRNGNETRVTWVRRDPIGNIIKVEHTTDDSYDPRTRPWYKGALEVEDIYWTDVYIFFTDQKPGVTAATAIRGSEGQILGVLSMDVMLEQLSAFLAGLNIGKNGQAVILDGKGTLVAIAEMERMLKLKGNELRPAFLKELGDSVLKRAFDRFRVEGHGIRQVTVDGQRIISAASPLSLTVGRDWTVLIVVPEEDFVGFVERNARKSLLMSTVVVGLASLLVGLLFWQGIKADRTAQLVLENRQQFELQSRAFLELTSESVLFGTTDTDSLERLTEIVSRSVGVRRASVWWVTENGASLICADAFDRESGGHTQGTVINRSDLPALFDTILKGKEIVLSDAGNDPQTAELHRVYLSPLGCHALLSLPVRLGDETIGSLWFEGQSTSRIWSSEEITFARAITGILAFRKETGKLVLLGKSQDDFRAGPPIKTQHARVVAGPGEIVASHNSVSPPGLLAGGRANRFYDRLAERGIHRKRLAADIFPNVTVFVLRFTDPVTLAKRIGKNAPAAMDYLVRHIEKLATARGLDYLKIMSNEVIGATGFDVEAAGRVSSVADLTLELQDRCRRILARLDAYMDFCFGVDTGPVIGSTVGKKGDYYNLWGDAVRTAAKLVESGVPGGIHVSESTYQHLRSDYVFKKRGTFYLEDTGEIQTYLLTGRL